MENSTQLYSFLGEDPATLPERVRLSDGSTRTNIIQLEESELFEIGFTGPYTIPEYDKKTQYISWSSEDLKYEVLDIGYDSLMETFLKELDKMIEYSEVTVSETIFCSEEKVNELQNFYDYLINLKENPPQTREELLAIPTLKRPSYDRLSDDKMNMILSGMTTCNYIHEVNDLLVANNIHLNYLAEEDVNLIIDNGNTILNITQ